MNKDLEKEYKELMSANVPDLWEKIEVGLEPKSPNGKKVNRLKNMRVWGAAAAAVFFLVISVPVVFGGRKGSSADNGMAGGNMSPAQNHENTADYADVWEKDISAPTADDDMLDTEGTLGEDALTSDIITAKVIEIWEEKGRTMLTVEIEDIYSTEANYMDFSEGDTTVLYDGNRFYEKSYKDLKEGQTYIFKIMILTDDSGAAEYLIEDIW